MTEEKERILVFCSREICYASGNFFANQLGAALEELGFLVQVCEFTREDDFDHILEPLLSNTYRLAVDFNSLLPRMELEDGTSFIEKLGCPFFDYVLDHPLFHYNCLVRGGKNFHAILLDEAQKDYVRRYHPNLAAVHMLPLSATKALYEGEKHPADRILFMGTYDRPDAVYELVKNAPEPLHSVMKNLIEQRLAEPTLPMEEAFCNYLKEQDMELPDEQFALFMNAMYPVDAYIRDYFRKAALDELTKKKIPLVLVGEGWQKYDVIDENYVTREKGVMFEHSFERIAKEPLLLNVSPIFNRGVHDRMFAGMANRTVVLTDENPYLRAHFKDREEIALYSLKELESLSSLAGELMENGALRERIAENGAETFYAHHTWRHRAKQILEWAQAY